MEEAYRQRVRDVLHSLRVVSSDGLSTREARKRLVNVGLNELPHAKRTRLLVLFFDRFRDLLVIILVLAGVISLLLGHIEDTIIIAVAVALDAALSLLQSWRTERTLAQMRKQVEDTITVIRDGKLKSLASRYLVPGDIIEFRAGERVPADARIIRASGLKTQEAALTGESSDVAKNTRPLTKTLSVTDQHNMVFAGTVIVSGNGTAVVTQTGTGTEFGKIAQLLREQRSPTTPLRQKLQRTGLQIGWAIIAAIGLLALVSLVRGDSLADTVRTAITLAVSAIPEDLTMILTIALTVGVRRILKQGGIVRRLNSGETLGAATVICTDKTGTLTEGNMRATGIHFLQGDTLDEFSRPREDLHTLAYTGLALATDAYRVGTKETTYVGSATARTALAFAESAGFSQSEIKRTWRLRDSIAFNARWKYRAALADHPTQATQTLFVVGAPDVLLEKSSQALDEHNSASDLTAKRRTLLQEKIESLAGQGKRLMAVAVRKHLHQQDLTADDVRDLTFLGVLAITDPVRREASEAIKLTQEAGVMVKLITGDHAATARAVAEQIGMSASAETIITGQRLQAMTDDELREALPRLAIFARVEPLDKQRIVRLLQEQGQVVAMTGDGVNDAVALKTADIGVAMQGGSDVAREAADLVLLDNSFATIVAAIKEGRVLRDNIRKVIAFLLATNAAEVAIFFVSIILGLPLPLVPAQILWINLVTDGTSDIALSLEPAESNVMHRAPEHPNAPLLGRRLFGHILFSGVIMTIATVGLFGYTFAQSGQLPYARTMAFTLMSVTSLLSVWSFRSLKQTIFQRGIWQNPWVLASTAFSLALHMTALYIPSFRTFFGTVPLGGRDWLLIGLTAVVTVALVDARKYILPSRKHIPVSSPHHALKQTPA